MVVIQPTSFCNLDCDYCYLPNRHLRNRLSLDLLEPIFKAVFTSRFLKEEVTICWHAGEPLAAGLAFYKAAFEKIEAIAQKYLPEEIAYNHSFQSNGLLINQDFCDLFKQYPVHVGISIDGPAFLHDAHRKTRSGLGSHAGAIKGIELLKKNDIATSAIAVITADALDYPDDIFDFFMSQGIAEVGFNMEETEGINTQSSLATTDTEARYKTFLRRIWHRIATTKDSFQLREFEEICNQIYTRKRLSSTDMNHPFSMVNIDYLGNFSTFDPELLSMPTKDYGDFVLGNVTDMSFEAACQTPKFQQIYRDMQEGVSQCQQSCEYFGLCGGGAGSNKYWENGTFASTETQACRYRIKAVTDIVLDNLEQSMEMASLAKPV
ncbi:MAG: cyclophane-forming radical SAM/SPASM peptide maturase GrrM/OscB [Cyanobacteria bacterium J06621_11]